jgi:hypothetical protein
MTRPPKIHDPGLHVRVGREPRPRPALTGVAALLEQHRGTTVVRLGCLEGTVRLTFGWRLTKLELADVCAAAGPRAGAPWESVVESVGDVLRGSDITAQLVTLEEAPA